MQTSRTFLALKLEYTVTDGGGSNGWTGAATSRGGVYVDGSRDPVSDNVTVELAARREAA